MLNPSLKIRLSTEDIRTNPATFRQKKNIGFNSQQATWKSSCVRRIVKDDDAVRVACAAADVRSQALVISRFRYL